MKKTNTVSTIAAVVLFCAMAAYLGFSLFSSMRSTMVTSPVVKTTVSETASIRGIAVRDELVIRSDRSYVSVQASDGAYLSRGSIVAVAMDSSAALQRESRRRELVNEIKHVETLLAGSGATDDLTKRNAAIRSAVLSLSACVSSGELTALDTVSAELSSLVFSNIELDVTEADLAALKAELASIESSSHSDSEDITAPEAGLFSTIIDGYEALSPSGITDISPSIVSRLIASKAEPESGAIGKLVSSSRWYFIAVMAEEAAAALTEGDSVTVSFSLRYGGDVRMRVDEISTASGGERAVRFSSVHSLAATLPMREAEAEIVSSSYTGLRVPAKALHVDEDGRSYVFVVTGNQLEKKFVDTIYQSGDYFLVEIAASPVALREGNEVVVSGRDLYDGKIID